MGLHAAERADDVSTGTDDVSTGTDDVSIGIDDVTIRHCDRKLKLYHASRVWLWTEMRWLEGCTGSVLTGYL